MIPRLILASSSVRRGAAAALFAGSLASALSCSRQHSQQRTTGEAKTRASHSVTSPTQLEQPAAIRAAPPVRVELQPGQCTPPPDKNPRVALLATDPEGTHTDLIVQSLQGLPAKPRLSLSHDVGASVKGVWLPAEDAVVVVVDRTRVSRDASWTGWLLLATPGEQRVLVQPTGARDGVSLSSRPFVADGLAYVVRGVPGQEQKQERLDAIRIEAINLSDGKSQVLYRTLANVAVVIGRWREALVVYVAAPDGARFEAIAPDRSVRTLARVAAAARDFSLNATSLAFTDRHPTERRWSAYQLSLAAPSASPREISSSANPGIFPHVWPGERVITDDTPRGLLLGDSLVSTECVGQGKSQVVELTENEAWAAGVQSSPAGGVLPFIVDVAAQRAYALPHVASTNLSIAGVAER